MSRFVIVDVDSTLIEDEVIELLADEAGSRDEVERITAKAMEGEIDFAGSLKERVATLAGLSESVLLCTLHRVTVTEGARQLIDAVHAGGGKIGAVSGGFSQILEPLADSLSLDYWRANELEIRDGVLTGQIVGPIIDARAKSDALEEWSTREGIGRSSTIAIGDGANDLMMMANAGLSVAFCAKPVVRQRASLCVNDRNLAHLITVL